jgi:hypothetical protein
MPAYLSLQHAPLALRLCKLSLQCCMLRCKRLVLLLLLARLRHAPLHAAAQRVKLALQVTARGVLRAEGIRLHRCISTQPHVKSHWAYARLNTKTQASVHVHAWCSTTR